MIINKPVNHCRNTWLSYGSMIHLFDYMTFIVTGPVKNK